MQTITLPNAIFPFSFADLAKTSYGDYEIEYAHQKLTEQQRAAVIDLWVANGVLSPLIAQRRCQQVCCLVSHQPTGKLIGVSTLYPSKVGEPPQAVLMMRMFLLPEHRRTLLASPVWKLTLLNAKVHLDGQGYLGVVNVNENRKLARNAMRRRFEEVGYQLIGQSNGQDVWIFEFSKHQIAEAQPEIE